MAAAALLLVVAAMLLASTGLLLQPASAQGLGVAPDLLGAGAQATATAFEEFEDVLNLATVGGRGRGGRGSSGNIGGFSDARDFEQTQAAMYYIAGSSSSYFSRAVGQPRDQGKCLTCVAHAATEAVEMAVASAMDLTRKQLERRGLTASPLSLYYCAAGGRSCNTGWDIPQALRNLVEAPQWLQPNECMNNTLAQEGLREAAVLNWPSMCKKATNQKACRTIKRAQPLYTCSYKSLSSFYQIQQHIRRHGSAITRITMPNDWEVQFNSSMRTVKGEDARPYRYNATARAAYGHALTIVGFDNQNFTWTLLNSWGSGNDPDNLRVKGGITADGLVKVRMGLLGVAQPEETYGVVCEPTIGTPENQHGHRPWVTDERRRILTPMPAPDDMNGACFNYTILPGEGVAFIVDHFDLDIRTFVQDAANRGLFRLEDFTYKFAYKLQAAEIALVIRTVASVTQVLAADPPRVECTGFDAKGAASTTVCTSPTEAGNLACAAPGISSCTLHYKDINVTQLQPGSTVRVCNPNWAQHPEQFYKVAYLSGVPLPGFKPDMPAKEAAALWTLVPLATAKFGTFNLQLPVNQMIFQCTPVRGRAVTFSWNNGATFEYEVGCSDVRNADGTRNVTSVDMEAAFPGQPDPSMVHPRLDDAMLYPLLRLQSLQQLVLLVYDGALPPQLGSLSRLNNVTISQYCLNGLLPPLLLRGLPELRALLVLPALLKSTYVSPTGEQCGITGPVPMEWQTTKSNITRLELPYHRLSGKLPNIGNWLELRLLDLQSNRFEGEVPLQWDAFFRAVIAIGNRNFDIQIDISNNVLQGEFPPWNVPLANSAIARPFRLLRLNGNTNLKGCVPVTGFSTLQYGNTQITGLCFGDPGSIESAQVAAMDTSLHKLLRFGQINIEYDAMISRSVDLIRRLGSVVDTGQTTGIKSAVAYLTSNNPWKSYMRLGVEETDGVAYITLIEVFLGGLNLTHLPQLAMSLPRLKHFSCRKCFVINGSYPHAAGDLLLPPTLPVAAPSLEVLDLQFTGIQGTLPREYGDWPSLQIMDLGANALTGTIPPWSNLSSIRYLQLAQNKLQGTLPAEMGLGNLPRNPELYFSYNKGITGTIPASWAHFSAGMLYLAETGIDGCIPDGMSIYTWSEARPDPYPYCSLKNSSDALVLSMLKAVLIAAGASPDSLSTWDTTPQATGPAASPRYCRLFKGVACDANSRVAQLDLTALGHDGQVNSLSLLNITKVISPLTNLKVLVLANLGISGSLADVMQPGFDAFPNLVTLDISGNPGVTGPLPDELAVLTNLQVLDVSGCSISGTLPISFVALQQLREFRAVNCTKLSGTLPEDWGMLANLEVLAVTNAGISGPLPLEYADYLAMQKVATRAATAAATAAARAAATAERSRRAASFPSGTSFGKNSTLEADADRAQRMRAAKDYSRAQQRAASAQRVAQAVQAAAGNATGRGASGLGMLKLRQLLLNGNNLSGSLPVQYAQMRDLQVVNLSQNQLVGTIPRVFASLTKLTVLGLGHNQLQGPLPAAFVSLRQLAALDVSNNMLSGSMPTSWRLMAGQGFRLQCLLLANNTSVMVNDGVRRELMTKNAARIPGTGLAIDDPSSSLCMLLR